MSTRVTPPPAGERWWVGASPPPGWRAIPPGDLPTDAVSYLAPAVVVLENVSAADLSDAAQGRFRQYVRDLGGSLVLLGGDHAFGSGGYDGTPLGAMSPLASSPPKPATLWMLLADASGSMAGDAGTGGTRWDAASAAVVRLLPRLPPEDPVLVGQFAETLRWWSDGKTARQTAALPLPPADALPRGPTNLQPVLEGIARDATDAVPAQLLLLTDADVAIDDPEALAARLKAKQIRLHLLAIGNGSGLAALNQIVAATGGTSLTQLDPARWAQSVQELLRSALPDRLGVSPLEVRFVGLASSVGGGTVKPWNRTWLKPDATPLAEAAGPDGPLTMAATWQVGTGRVLAVSFAPAVDQAAALAALVAQPPRDPRLKVSWDAGPTLDVSVDAVDGGAYLNRLGLTLDVRDDEATEAVATQPIPQTAPGLYELSTPAPRRPSLATVRLGGRVVDRFAVPGRYAPEFDAVGTDLGSLESLANRSGGAVVPPAQTSPIAFDWPRQETPLLPWLAAAAAASLAAGLMAWKRE